jgi:hypothetical protein
MTDLRNHTETELLELVRNILAKPTPLTGIDRVELLEVNYELKRRDVERLAKKYHPVLRTTDGRK